MAPRPCFLPLVDREPTSSWRPEAPPSLEGIDVIELDCETTGLHRQKDRPVGIALGYAGRTQYLPFAHKGGGPQLDEAIVKRWARTELRGKHIRNHNTKFDIHLMESWGVPLREMGCTFHDTAHSEALLDDNESALDLNHLAKKRLGKQKLSVWKSEAIADLPADAVGPYAERDVELVRLLVEHYAPLLAADELERVSHLEDDVIPVCVEMERNGLPLDMPLLGRWAEESRVLLNDLQWALERLAGFAVNPDSPADMTRLFRQCGVPIPKREKVFKTKDADGRVRREVRFVETFDTQALEPLLPHHERIRLAYQIGKVKDLRSKSIVKYLKDAEDGVLYPNFNQLKYDREGGAAGAVSGRFSSSSPNGQNIQNYDKLKEKYAFLMSRPDPWIIRKAFIAGSGRLLVADQSQVEVRIAAHMANATRLIHAYLTDPDTDAHDVVVAMLRERSYPTTRTKAKAVGLGRLYGRGIAAIAEAQGMTYAQGVEFMAAYDAAFPEWGAFIKSAESVARTRGYVKTILGRRARFREGDRFYSAGNRVCQGTSADIMKLTLVDVYRERRALGLVMRATVHDELMSDLLDGYEMAPVTAMLNEQRVALKVPITWAAGVGATWHDAK